MKAKNLVRCGVAITVVMIIIMVASVARAQKASVESKPIKIGVLLPFTGPHAAYAKNCEAGTRLFFDQVNWKVAGREIKLIIEDDETKADVGLRKARKLVESDKVDLLAGVVHSHVAYAVRNYVDAAKTPLVISGACGAKGLSSDKRSDYVFRVTQCSGQDSCFFGPYAYNKLGYRKMSFMTSDFAYGHELLDAIIAAFQQAGGEVVSETYAPVGTADFAPYLAKIDVRKNDALFAYLGGADSVHFVKQYAQFGLKDRLPLLYEGTGLDESFLADIGDSALGILSSLQYSAAFDSPQAKSFVQKFQGKYNDVPGISAYWGYLGAQVIYRTLKAIDGDTDPAKFVKTIQTIDLGESPMGPIRFETGTNSVIYDLYLRKVEKIGNRYQNTVIDVIRKDVKPSEVLALERKK